MTPKKVFFTKGIGRSKHYLSSFEDALRDAGIEKCNLVTVSSILPPKCEIISRDEGLKLLTPGQITFCVMARNSSNEGQRVISSSVGLAIPADDNTYGYLSEHHPFGQSEKESGDYAEDLAVSMLGSTMGIEIDPNTSWNEKKNAYISSGKIIETSNITASSSSIHNEWCTTVACAVFIF